MAYKSGNRMPCFYEGKDYYMAQSRIRKKLRKTDSIKLEDLIDSYHKSKDDEFDYLDHANFTEESLKFVLRDIRNGTYKPCKPRIVQIPKSKGGFRTLSVPPLIDRVVSKAVLAKISPIVDAKFDPRNHGGRPELGIHSTIAEAYKAIEAGMRFIVSGDIKDAYPSVPTEDAITILERLSENHKCLELAKVCIRGHFGHKKKLGLDQGNPLSSICFNSYMHEWLDGLIPLNDDIRYVRYLDNVYLFGKDPDKLMRIMEKAKEVLANKGLVLKSDPCIDLICEKLSILGYQIGLNSSKIVILGDKDMSSALSESLIRAYDRPNSHKLGKPIVSSWLASQALRSSLDPSDTNKVNELLEYHGFQDRINHEVVIKDLQHHRCLWAQKYLNNIH